MSFAPTHYERITFRPEGATRSKTIFLREPKDRKVSGHPVVMGLQVDRFGNNSGDRDPRVSECRHIISAALISARDPYRLSLHYGELQSVA
jgi:hypothetical protein